MALSKLHFRCPHKFLARDFSDLRESTLNFEQRASSKSKIAAAAFTASKSNGEKRKLLSDVVWPSAGAFVAMAMMSAVHKRLEPIGLTFLVAPFGAVCCVLFLTPDAPAAQDYNVLAAHVGCALIGVLSLTLLGSGWAARSVALAACLAYMEYAKCLHPPAAGLPLLFIDVPKFHTLKWWYALFPSVAGCILLLALKKSVKFLKENVTF